MTSIIEFFQTDFSAMTASDYVGLAMTIIIFLAMAAAYVYAFHPKNKERFNSYGDIPLNEDLIEKGESK